MVPPQLVQFGLGSNLTESVSNNRDYSWYLDQGNTGPFSDVNCGPSSVTMAIKWFNKSFTLTPQDARAMFRPDGGWWYTNDIINYLNYNTVTNSTIALKDISLLKNELDNGNIVILALDMYYVDLVSNLSYHVDKFYLAQTKGWGHFIVIKGYKVVDNQIFYEAYDPYSFGKTYADHTLKGIDRYYRSANLDNATNNWWDYAIVVSPPAHQNGGRVTGSMNEAVDPATIQHKPGR